MTEISWENLEIGQLTVVLRSRTPLLMNNPRGMEIEEQKKGKGLQSKKVYIPEEEAEISAYKNDEGYLVFPSTGPRKSMLLASVGAKIGKRAAYKILAGAILVQDEFFVLTNHKGRKLKNYVIDKRRAVIPPNKAIIRHRARVDEWQMTCTYNYIPLVNIAPIRDAFIKAGITVGVGDFRTACNGWFGTFDVTDIYAEISGEVVRE